MRRGPVRARCGRQHTAKFESNGRARFCRPHSGTHPAPLPAHHITRPASISAAEGSTPTSTVVRRHSCSVLADVSVHATCSVPPASAHTLRVSIVWWKQEQPLKPAKAPAPPNTRPPDIRRTAGHARWPCSLLRASIQDAPLAAHTKAGGSWQGAATRASAAALRRTSEARGSSAAAVAAASSGLVPAVPLGWQATRDVF